VLPTGLVIPQQTRPARLKLVPVVQIVRCKAANQHRVLPMCGPMFAQYFGVTHIIGMNSASIRRPGVVCGRSLSQFLFQL
jgi:hypothetical protein